MCNARFIEIVFIMEETELVYVDALFKCVNVIIVCNKSRCGKNNKGFEAHMCPNLYLFYGKYVN